ncbi:DUF6640 family protein [Georgenia muralis]
MRVDEFDDHRRRPGEVEPVAAVAVGPHVGESGTMPGGVVLLRVVAGLTAVGGFAADWNRTHLFNPAWPPHARFHDAMTISLGALLGGVSLYALRDGAQERELVVGAAGPAVFWAAMASAFAYPGAEGLESEFPRLVPQVRGVWIDERFAAGAMLALGGAGYALETTARRRRRGAQAPHR